MFAYTVLSTLAASSETWTYVQLNPHPLPLPIVGGNKYLPLDYIEYVILPFDLGRGPK